MDEDAAAFLGHGCLELDAEESCSKAQASTFCTKSACLDLEEPRARLPRHRQWREARSMVPGLRCNSPYDRCRHELFTDLDTLARGSVRFDDESKVEIHGVGSIIF
jgi:hypothetical protein